VQKLSDIGASRRLNCITRTIAKLSRRY
jgi:hypothetical protein